MGVTPVGRGGWWKEQPKKAKKTQKLFLLSSHHGTFWDIKKFLAKSETVQRKIKNIYNLECHSPPHFSDWNKDFHCCGNHKWTAVQSKSLQSYCLVQFLRACAVQFLVLQWTSSLYSTQLRDADIEFCSPQKAHWCACSSKVLFSTRQKRSKYRSNLISPSQTSSVL